MIFGNRFYSDIFYHLIFLKPVTRANVKCCNREDKYFLKNAKNVKKYLKKKFEKMNTAGKVIAVDQ
jgi:NADH:ubiquinone oxidoreductase subunit E